MWVRRLPVGAGLAAVGIAEREVHAGDLFVLQQDPDHVGEREVGAEREFADAVAERIGVAVVPELAFELLPRRTRAETSRPPAISSVSGVGDKSPYFGPK